MGEVEESFTFDPRDLVRKPYIECPKCKQIALGIVIVGNGIFVVDAGIAVIICGTPSGPKGGSVPRPICDLQPDAREIEKRKGGR